MKPGLEIIWWRNGTVGQHLLNLLFNVIKSAEQRTGLGLPIMQAIIASHDGHVNLRSKLRESTEGIAILPSTRVLQSVPAVEDALQWNDDAKASRDQLASRPTEILASAYSP